MTKNQRKSRDKAEGGSPAKDGGRREGKGRDEGGKKRKSHGGGGGGGLEWVVVDSKMVGDNVAEGEVKRESEIAENAKKKENGGEVVKDKGSKEVEVRKGGKKVDERRGDGAKGKLEDAVNMKKKKRKGMEGEIAEHVEDGARRKMKLREDSAEKSKENGGSKNGGEDGPKAIASTSGGEKVDEDEARKSSKKLRERKGVDDGQKSGLSKKQKQGDGGENADEMMKNGRKSNGSVSQSDPSVVLSLSRGLQKSWRASPIKKRNEIAEGERKKPSEPRRESKKRKSSVVETKDVSVPISSTEEGVNQAEKDNGDRIKKIKAIGEKAKEQGPKSCSLPFSRVRTIMRSYNSTMRLTQECYPLICKATECFIDQFCEDAFELAAFRGLNNYLKYEHLSSLVYNMDRYDFLSDYIPQKRKAKDAIAEAKASES